MCTVSCRLQPVLCSAWPAIQDSRLSVTSDIMRIVVSVPLSHVWPYSRQESEDFRSAKTLVSPTSVILCNPLTQQLNISVTQNEEIKGNVPKLRLKTHYDSQTL